MNKIHLPLYSLMGLFITSELTASEDNDKKNVTHQVSQISTTDKKEPTEYKEVEPEDNRIDRPVPKWSWEHGMKNDPDYWQKRMEIDTKHTYRVETESERRGRIITNMAEVFEEVNGSGGFNEQGSGQPSPCCVM